LYPGIQAQAFYVEMLRETRLFLDVPEPGLRRAEGAGAVIAACAKGQ